MFVAMQMFRHNDYTHEALVQSIPKLMEEKYHDVVEYIFANMMTKTDTSELERFFIAETKVCENVWIWRGEMFKGETKSNMLRSKPIASYFNPYLKRMS